jgi:hypothetical protein
VRLWQRRRREEERPVEEPQPPVRPVELPKLAGGGEQLRKAFLDRLERRDDEREDEPGSKLSA